MITAKPTEDRPVFILELKPEPGVDPVLALRAVLKVAPRRYGLRCVSASQKNLGEQQP